MLSSTTRVARGCLSPSGPVIICLLIDCACCRCSAVSAVPASELIMVCVHGRWLLLGMTAGCGLLPTCGVRAAACQLWWSSAQSHVLWPLAVQGERTANLTRLIIWQACTTGAGVGGHGVCGLYSAKPRQHIAQLATARCVACIGCCQSCDYRGCAV
ncbi:hypothetical protein COO60DRAFT_1546329, partial [Scenedesmus sp. NREL 46B-D3]